MGLAHLAARWAVWRTFGTPARVVAETPSREPVLALEGDRLVLRRADGRFWLATRCPSCAAETASVDFRSHAEACGRTQERGRERGSARDRPQRPPTLENRSSARVFGHSRRGRPGSVVLVALVVVAIGVALTTLVAALSS